MHRCSICPPSLSLRSCTHFRSTAVNRCSSRQLLPPSRHRAPVRIHVMAPRAAFPVLFTSNHSCSDCRRVHLRPSHRAWHALRRRSSALRGCLFVHAYYRAARVHVQTFDAEFFRKAKETGLLEEHKKATGSDKLPRGGYPDMGNGRFSDLVSYDKWLNFNNAQRAHYNYIEGAPSIIALLLLSGLFFPRVAAGTGLAYIVGRELYSAGYTSSGPNGRLAGTVLIDLALLVLFGMALYGGVRMTGLLPAAIAF